VAATVVLISWTGFLIVRRRQLTTVRRHGT
jgi:hypothetical protein